MDISKVPIGTCLVWDAKNPDEKHVEILRQHGVKDPARLLYPARVDNHQGTRPGMRKVSFSKGNAHYMGPEVEWLRPPTSEEKASLKWDW